MRLSKKAIFGIVVTVLLLWWTLRDVSLAEVAHELRNADPLLFLLAVAGQVVGMVIRAMRWRVLLAPIDPNVPFRIRFAAVNIGFAANNVFPARVGEFARAYAIGRLGRMPVSAGLASLVVERLLDGLVLVAFLFLAMASPAFPALTTTAGIDPRAAAGVIALVMGGFGVVLFFMVSAPERSIAVAERLAIRLLPERLRRPVLDALRAFLGGLAVLQSPRLFAASVGWAVLQWGFLALTFFVAFRAFGIHETGIAGAFFLQSLIALAVAVPSSPGFFGPYEAAAKLGLALWAVAPEKAVSFAVGFHLGGFVPVTLMGAYYVWRMGLSWRDVEKSEEVVEELVEEELPDVLPSGNAAGSEG